MPEVTDDFVNENLSSTYGWTTVEEMRAGKVKGVFYSADLSEKSRKELSFAAQKFCLQPIALDVQMEEIQQACGKRSGVIAVCDEGFAKKLSALAQQRTGQKHS